MRKAKVTNIIAVVCGFLVFATAKLDNVPLFLWIIGDPVGLATVIMALFSLVLLWRWIGNKPAYILRMLVAFQVSMILVAISYSHFPNVVIMANGNHLSLFKNQAPFKTMQALGWALILGSLFILPALFYLYYSFQKKKPAGE